MLNQKKDIYKVNKGEANILNSSPSGNSQNNSENLNSIQNKNPQLSSVQNRIDFDELILNN